MTDQNFAFEADTGKILNIVINSQKKKDTVSGAYRVKGWAIRQANAT